MASGCTAQIGLETETSTGWSYDVEVRRSDDVVTNFCVTLSWADHDLITKGLRPPSATVRAALAVALDQPAEVLEVAELPRRFDLSTLRRRIEGFDDAVRERLA